MREKSIQILKNLQYPNGLFAASSKNVSTGYNKSWIRDNIYEALGMENVDMKDAIKTYHTLLDIFLKHEYKIDWAMMDKPQHKHQYIHARFCPETLNEFWEDWGNKQNDAIGAFLFKVGELTNNGHQILRNRHDFRIIQKLIYYLESIKYWKDEDNGMWEENEEVHASSVGACLAGLKTLKGLKFKMPLINNDFINDLVKTKNGMMEMELKIPKGLIQKGQNTLNTLLPRESITKETDLALLSLIYPYNVVSEKQRKQILENIERKLVRYNGVIRYKDDKYYGTEFGEPEWTMGFPWLAIIYRHLGDMSKYHFYMYKTTNTMNKQGELPELYFARTDEYNENTPLGWSQALYLVASSN
jgi:phosphorylase kinase alpha/beta subunit